MCSFVFLIISYADEVSLFILILCLDGQPLLASGGSSGVISIWNLEKRRLQSVIRDAHDGSILSLHFLANEPVLMSSSSDNSIKVRLPSVAQCLQSICCTNSFSISSVGVTWLDLVLNILQTAMLNYMMFRLNSYSCYNTIYKLIFAIQLFAPDVDF